MYWVNNREFKNLEGRIREYIIQSLEDYFLK